MLSLKNKNNLFLILGVALVAVVLGSVVTASLTGFIVFPNQRVQNAPTIKANSCNADSSCEVEQITTTRGTNLLITSANKYIRMMDKVIIQKYLILPEILFQNPLEDGKIGADPENGAPKIFVEQNLEAGTGQIINLKEGDSYIINGKVVKLEAVGTENAVVSVDGVSKVISVSNILLGENAQVVNGYAVTVHSIIAKSNKGESSAELVVNYSPQYINTLVINGVPKYENSAPTTRVRINGQLYVTGMINTNSLTVADLGKIRPRDTTANAFVCVRENGFLYRSSTACV